MADLSSFKRPSLGIGAILSQSVSVLFSRFVLFFLVALAVYVVVILVNAALGTTERLLDPEVIAADPQSYALTYAANIVVSFTASSIITGIIVLGAYDALRGSPSRPAAYIGAALGVIVPLVVLSLVVNVAFLVGVALFILPGLYIAALWSAVVPAIVVEQAGFGALGRSRELTKNYRGPIMGLLVVTLLAVGGISIALSYVLGLVFGIDAFAPSPTDIATIASLPYQLVGVVTGAVPAAFTAVVTAVLFARLKEIKEGVGYEELGRVFD